MKKERSTTMYHSGIDLHKDNCYFTTLNGEGNIVGQEKIYNNDSLILEYIKSFKGQHYAAIESTSNWYWLNDLLESNGVEVTLAHAKHLKAIAYAKVKTDKIDSTTIAKLLRMDLITPAHKISKELRGLRDTMRMRLRLVHKRTSCYNSIHRIAEKFNCDNNVKLLKQSIPEVLPESYRDQVKLLYEQIDLLNKQINIIEKSLNSELIPNEDIQRLLWVGGIGLITSFTIYLEIDGIERFSDEKKFVSYCRLVPGAKNSNKTIRQKSGNKDGNKYLKIAFTDASVHAIRYYPEIRDYYNKLRRRKKESVARTIIAKQLAVIVYHILKDKTEYKGFKGRKIVRQKKQTWPRLTSPLVGLAD